MNCTVGIVCHLSRLKLLPYCYLQKFKSPKAKKYFILHDCAFKAAFRIRIWMDPGFFGNPCSGL